MWENAIWAVVGAMLGVGLATLKDWIWDRLPTQRGIRIEIGEERAPVSREYGFTEKTVKVTVKNQSDRAIEIRDVRLMFTKTHGVAVMAEAPPPRSHDALPTALEPETTKSWHFPAEKLASLLQSLSPRQVPEKPVAILRPQVTSATGRVYRGSEWRFSTDVDTHWP